MVNKELKEGLKFFGKAAIVSLIPTMFFLTSWVLYVSADENGGVITTQECVEYKKIQSYYKYTWRDAISNGLIVGSIMFALLTTTSLGGLLE